MIRPTPEQPELLAPAGSLEAFFAALENGADAIYCGLREFSARAKAKNFSLAELELMLNYAHARQKRVFVTLNTLVKERELPLLVETLAALESLGVHAVILQDLAVWRLARRHFPQLELHASTQLTVHNAAGVRQLERMGFRRAVLARELTLEEISAIARDTTLELEHFIHGALCFSFSGQCFFSSWLGGKSGNRGRCAQPCRRRYHQGGKGPSGKSGYYFSPNDLSAIDLLPELTGAGICSLKIEGRMKSAEYVANVVSAYRMALNAAPAQRQAVLREAKEKLRQSFGRLPTRGFLPGPTPADIASPAIHGATGRKLGEITGVGKGTLSFKTSDRLHVGDRLRIQPRSDQAGHAFTLRELSVGQRSLKQAAAGSQVTVASPFSAQARKRDAVFKVSSEQAFTLSAAACRKRLEAAPQRSWPLRLEVAFEGDRLRLRGQCAGLELEREFAVESFPAEKSPLSSETLREVFAQGGEEALALEELSCGELPAVVIAPKRLKEIRREFYREMGKALRAARQQQLAQRRAQALATLLPATPPPVREQLPLSVAVADSRDIHLLKHPGVDNLLLPLNAAVARNPEVTAQRVRERRRIIWDIPFILLGDDWHHTRHAVQILAAAGFRAFRLNNLGHFPLFDGLEEMRLSTGYRLFSVNTQAMAAWGELGAHSVTLYLEDERANLADILCRDTGLSAQVTVYAQVEVLTSRIAIPGVRPRQPLTSDRDEAYTVTRRDGLSVLAPQIDFSLLGRLSELRRLGAAGLVAELGHLGAFSPRGRQVMDAMASDRPLPGTSLFNYEQGWE